MVTGAPAGSVAMVSAPASHPLRRGAWSCLTETAWAEATWTRTARNRNAAPITQSYGVPRQNTLSRTPYEEPGVYCLLIARSSLVREDIHEVISANALAHYFVA